MTSSAHLIMLRKFKFRSQIYKICEYIVLLKYFFPTNFLEYVYLKRNFTELRSQWWISLPGIESGEKELNTKKYDTKDSFLLSVISICDAHC